MNHIKKILSLLLILTVAVAFMPVNDASAAVKISASSKVIYVGSSCTLKITGTKKAVKWSSSNKAVATVTTKGKVTAKTPGTASIKAKIGTKTYKCKVTVKDNFNSKEALKNIKYTVSKINKGIVLVIKNNNSYAVQLTADAVYFDSNGNKVGTSNDKNYCLDKNSECSMFLDNPFDDNYKDIEFDTYKLNLKASKPNNPPHSSKIAVKSQLEKKEVTAEVTNNNNIELSSIRISIVYYDASGKIIGHDSTSSTAKKPGSTDKYISFRFPRDDNNKYVVPAKYKIFVDYAFKWKGL